MGEEVVCWGRGTPSGITTLMESSATRGAPDGATSYGWLISLGRNTHPFAGKFSPCIALGSQGLILISGLRVVDGIHALQHAVRWGRWALAVSMGGSVVGHGG